MWESTVRVKARAVTAEIAVMNREAVALAADSAATIAPDGTTRMVFPSQNKLFALSSVAPVGIMVYGQGELIGVPWDTLIKGFRHKLGATTYTDLPKYAEEFCEYLKKLITKAFFSKANNSAARDYDGTSSGIVVAGFGDINLFPVAQEYTVRIAGNALQVQEGTTWRVAVTANESYVLPFAQNDMATLFMNGLAPEYVAYLRASLEQVLTAHRESLLADMIFDSDQERDEYIADDVADYPKVFDDFGKSLSRKAIADYRNPILRIVSVLPKEQLAGMAEALINLTTLKRQVTLGSPSVGGPTDVALISKGDGFVWIKRKHYFPAHLNAAYFARTYGGKGGSYGSTDGAD